MKIGNNLVVAIDNEVMAYVDDKWGGKISIQNRLAATVGDVVRFTPHAPSIVAGYGDDPISALASVYAAYGDRFTILECPFEVWDFLNEWSEDNIRAEGAAHV